MTSFPFLTEDLRVGPQVKSLVQREYPEAEPARPIFLAHSQAVAELAWQIACRVGAREQFVLEAAWLHDIGIRYTRAPGIGCHGSEPYLRHGVIGREICEAEGLHEHALVCERHVGTGLTASEILAQKLPLPPRDMLCRTQEERIVCYADQFFSKSTPGALSLDEVRRRVARHGEAPLERFESMHREFAEIAGSTGGSA
ncbi:MAG: HDIG domain-containing metalloprotein [Vulcanimicrobiota bacterium]